MHMSPYLKGSSRLLSSIVSHSDTPPEKSHEAHSPHSFPGPTTDAPSVPTSPRSKKSPVSTGSCPTRRCGCRLRTLPSTTLGDSGDEVVVETRVVPAGWVPSFVLGHQPRHWGPKNRERLMSTPETVPRSRPSPPDT